MCVGRAVGLEGGEGGDWTGFIQRIGGVWDGGEALGVFFGQMRRVVADEVEGGRRSSFFFFKHSRIAVRWWS